jgi:hypothetical protein
MPNLRISALPLKTNLDTTDIVPVIDTQFGASRYISKRTTVGDIINLARGQFVAKIDFGGVVATVNGQSGNAILTVATLADVTVSSPADADLLAYNNSQQRWVNKSVANEVLDCGTF